MKSGKDKSYALRIDAKLVEPLQKLKKHNRRSLNAEINAALDDWVSRSDLHGGEQTEAKLPSPDGDVGSKSRKTPHPKRPPKAR